MRWNGYRLLQLAARLVPALWLWPAPACNVPVFRYALERWEADPFQAFIFYREPVSADQQALMASLEKGGLDAPANLVVNRVNLAQELSQPLRALWSSQESPATPWLVLRYPKQTGIERPAWAGPLDAEVVRSLAESPARRGIAEKLLGGDAVVWLLLECGDKRRDDETSRLVEAELRTLEKSLVLPERSPSDPPINPDLPLKIAFSTMRIARSDPMERMLVNLLLNWNTNLTATQEPMLFPIFGRGRVIPPAVADEIRADAIREMAEFLTGACSCEVKAMNPGYDLLLAANWSSLPAYQELALPSSPPLVGLSQFASDAASNPPGRSPPPGASVAAATPASAPIAHNRLVRSLVVVSGSGIVFLAVATLVLRAKSNTRRPRQPSSPPLSETAGSDKESDKGHEH